MRHFINQIQAVKMALFNALAYLPRKAYIAMLMLLTSPALSLALGEDINSMADKWTGYFGTLKKLFWSGLALVGITAFIYGLSMLVIINTKADYRGKMTSGKALIIMALGVLAAGGSIIFGVFANSLGATDAMNNATSNDYSGFN
jgi:phosphoglycerol transferase MdoB-like AlkP superfamily enzyme